MVDHPGRRGIKKGGDTPPLRVAVRQEGGLKRQELWRRGRRREHIIVDHPGRRGSKLGGDTPPLRVAAREEAD